MTEQDDLFTGARRVFWGYFFLLLDFNLNLGSAVTIPLLANCVGWIFLWRGVDALAPVRPSLDLLKPFCTALGVCSLTQFVPALDSLLPGWLSLFISILTLYTHFQLLTDLAALAEEMLDDGELAKRLRTSRTLFLLSQTAMYCYDLVLQAMGLVVLLLAVTFCVSVLLLFQLWGFSRDLETQQSP